MMRFFDQKFSLAILLLTLPLLFIPKINLLHIDSSETAGLRIDDLILLIAGSFLMWSHALRHQQLSKIEGLILLITVFSLISFLTNRFFVSLELLHMDAKIFYVIRLFEYFIFFYIGTIASQYVKGSVFIRAFFLFNLLLMALQKLNLAGGVMAAGYHADVSGRVQGIASFPSEMGLLLNLIFCYLIYDNAGPSKFVNLFRSPNGRNFLHKIYPYWMFSLFAVFVIFTGNRISILALIVCFVFRQMQDFNWRTAGSWITAATLAPLVLAGAAFILIKTAGVYERSLDLFSWRNLELFEIVWDKIDIAQIPLGNEIVSSENYDMSWWIRIHKWLFAIKSYAMNPECYLQGLGPGFCGAALDGGFLRIAVEYGAAGAFLFWKFFSALYRLNMQAKWMVIAFAINMLFFDAYLAYKTMSFLLFTCGYIYANELKKQHAGIGNASIIGPQRALSTQRAAITI